MEEVKYWKTQCPKRLAALYLALNWYLTDLEDIRELSNPDSEWLQPSAVNYSTEELEERLAQCYVGRFRTKRLRKKHRSILTALYRSQEKYREPARAN